MAAPTEGEAGRRSGARLSAAAWLLVLAPGCFASIDLDLLDGGGPAPDGGIVTRPDAGFGCPPQSLEVQLGGTAVCVDRHETTNEEYARFLASTAPDQPSFCRWNGSFVPAQDWPFPQGQERRPVTSIDWCDALAYCTWAGGRLCGKIGGGAPSLATAGDPAQSEWAAACSHGGDTVYPYGDTFEAGRCNGAGGPNSAVDVESLAGCVGGYPGLFDLSGNVREWLNACEPGQGASGSNDDCASLGGSYASGEGALTCASVTPDRRSRAAPDRGVRCCRDP